MDVSADLWSYDGEERVVEAYCDRRINPLHVALLHQYLADLCAQVLDLAFLQELTFSKRLDLLIQCVHNV